VYVKSLMDIVGVIQAGKDKPKYFSKFVPGKYHEASHGIFQTNLSLQF
jgi:hypothetical protein